jgi:hypothetical protein
MKLKICGMKYPENILEVAALHRLYGIYILGKSSRYFDANSELPKSIKKQAFCKRIDCDYYWKIIKIIYKQCNYMVKNLQILLKFEEWIW